MNRFSLLFAASLAATTTASAFDEWHFCDTTFTNQMFKDTLATVDTALSQADLAMANTTMVDLERDLMCLEDLADKTSLARYGRMKTMLFFFNQDEEEASRWALLSKYTDPSATFPGEIPEGHPMLDVVDNVEDAILTDLPEGKRVDIPNKGAVFLNGEMNLDGKAYAGVPYLVQVYDDKAKFVRAYWQDGSAWPDKILVSDDGTEAKPPKWWDAENQVIVKPTNKRDKSGLKPDKSGPPIVPLAAAGGLALLSGGLYAAAGAAKGGMGDAATTSDLTQKRSTANTLAIGAGVSLAGAVGVGVTGVMLSNNGFVITGRF